MQESTISGALCDVMAQALIEKGIDADLARTLAERACQPALSAAPAIAKATVRSARKKARRTNSKLSAAFKEANRRLRTKSGKLRKGKTQADVARLAQRLRKKM
jgi:hypothetical protein